MRASPTVILITSLSRALNHQSKQIKEQNLMAATLRVFHLIFFSVLKALNFAFSFASS